MTNNIIHAFEKAGLGTAPFCLVRIEERRYRAHPDAPSQPGGACDFCGEGIVECCIIRDVNGKEFKVGNQCVFKTGDRGLIDLVKREVNKKRTESRHIREAAKIKQIEELLKNEALCAKLQAEDHPYDWAAAKGLTMLDYANYTMAHAGNKGRLDLGKLLEKKGFR